MRSSGPGRLSRTHIMRMLNHRSRLIRPLFIALLILSACDPVSSDDAFEETYEEATELPTPFAETCAQVDDFLMAEMHKPTADEIEGDWLGQLSGPVTWTFNDGEVTRYDMVIGTCADGLECSSYIVSYGSYKIHNALLLLEWSTQGTPNGSELPDLMYVQRGCNTGTIWLFESNMEYGQVAYAAI